MKENARARYYKDLPPKHLGPYIKTREVLGRGKWTLLGALVKLWGLGLRANWHGIEALRMGIHMSVVVAAAVPPWRRVCVLWSAGRQAWPALSKAADKSGALSPCRFGAEW